jgi:DNA-directed RNA polymerase
VEVSLEKTKKGPTDWKTQVIQRVVKGAQGRKDVTAIIKKVKNLMGDEEWTPTAHVKIGSSLLQFLMNSAVSEGDPGRPVFIHSTIASKKNKVKTVGVIEMNKEVYDSLALMDKQQMETVFPRYLPMLIPPRPWDNRNRKSSCYLRLKCKLIRSYSQGQHLAVAHAHMDKLLESVNYVASIPWRINDPVFKVINECWSKGILVGEIPARVDFPMPLEKDAVRLPLKPFNPSELKNASSKKAMTEANMLYWQARFDKIIGEHPADDPFWTTPAFDERHYHDLCRHVKKKNAELHSLRCDMELKISIAKKFKNETFYFPYSLDFRGRAYPVPPNLNHLGSDLCRGLLLFDKPEPLGEKGLDWLKIHLANVCGHNKVSQAERIAWADNLMDKVRASAEDPLNETNESCRWWMSGEEPFQILAVCKEIVNAVDSGDPVNYMCSLPVHQDGSCNGLQHYAALGRDAGGGAAVNLCPSDKPQDVYSKVLEIVNRKIEADALLPEDHPDPALRNKGKIARNLVGLVNRKVIKQSVMTSVYGVTRRGAALQVHARLQEKLLVNDEDKLNIDKERELMPWAM